MYLWNKVNSETKTSTLAQHLLPNFEYFPLLGFCRPAVLGTEPEAILTYIHINAKRVPPALLLFFNFFFLGIGFSLLPGWPWNLGLSNFIFLISGIRSQHQQAWTLATCKRSSGTHTESYLSVS